ncbi:MAG: alpha-N-arabinofuranosidase [Tessaracoccus sp.]|uniref:arabinosylfuranosidase ArfA n=1 Tax=Tessaracoccus sp. TaxID=1971211 RepID=UPI001ECA89EE|nr:alpha-N-arabinofuranosidase [Tessaracoccus sp.]MBK7820906.1 alpha-N-arabinofuranosidase [Tessaracoccus sp.]
MSEARITFTPDFVVGPVRRRTFGSFVEHLGRCVYEGIYEPGHPTADAKGFRGDVIELVRELGVSTVRYPGGNFVSGYRWEDGVGPRDQRPRRLDLAWHSTDPNWVGLDDFMDWAHKADIEPMMAVNLGTRGVAEALDILEYANIPGGTTLSDQRRANGAEEPHRITLWCLGNEMDGPWQTAARTAHEYGRIASQTAKAMRMVNPDLELVACGSSNSGMPTFGTWEREVLQECFDDVDMISAHSYYWVKDGDLQGFLLSAVDMDRFIASIAATADAVAAARKSTKRIGISFDEWNVWYSDGEASQTPTGDDWPVAPHLLEDNYTVADAVVVGNLLISLLRNTDRVWVANQAQLVNVIAPIMTEVGGPAWKQTIFHPFALTARHAQGEVLRVNLDAPIIDSPQFGEAPAIDAVATHDVASGETAVFLVNRSATETITVRATVPGARLVEAVTFHNEDNQYKASAGDHDSVVPQPNASASLTDDELSLDLPPVSWSMVRLG